MIYRATQKKLRGLIGMAKMLWKNRIGEEKTVNDITFKFVDYVDGKVIVVDSVNHETHKVSRDVWNRGVFKSIMKKLNSHTPHIGDMIEERIVNNVAFRLVGVVKNKVNIVANGCDYVFTMTKKTWKESTVFKNVFALIKKLGLIVKRVVKVVEDVVEKYEIMIHPLWQQVYNMDNATQLRKNMWTDGYEYTVKDFDYCESMSELKDVYRKLAKQYHPDMPTGDREKFELMQVCYEFAKASLEGLDDLLAEFM